MTVRIECDADSKDYLEIDSYSDGSLAIDITEDTGGDRRNDSSVIYITNRDKAIKIRDAIDVWINGGAL